MSAGWDVSAVYSENEHANRDAADTVIVGLEESFQDLDPKVPLWTFDTDTDGVTSVVDDRDLGSTATPEQLRVQDVLRVPVYGSRADIPRGDDRVRAAGALVLRRRRHELTRI